MLAALWQFAERVRGFFTRGSDFDDELGAHLEMLTADYVKSGMSPKEARRAALVRLGGVSQLREAHREARGLGFAEMLLQDLRYAFRALRKSPGFTTLAVLTLSIGIGVNTAVFSAYNAAVLRPVQAVNPERMVQVTRDSRDDFFSYPDYRFYREYNRSFSGLAAILMESVSMAGVDGSARGGQGIAASAGFQFPQTLHGSSERVRTAVVPGDYFQMLGTPAAKGRTLLAEDDAPGAPPVALISENFWERRFGRDPGLPGRTLTLNGIAFTVVGITPRDNSTLLPIVPDLWLPLGMQGRLSANVEFGNDRNAACCRVFGRLREGVTRAQAEAEMNALAARLELTHPDPSRAAEPEPRFQVVHASPNGPPEGGATLLAILVLAAVSLVLLIACANVASLLLARAAARQREIAIRLAIGAGRGRLLRQLLTENAVVSLMAGLFGTLFSWWALHLLMLEIAASMPPEFGAFALNLAPDHRVLAYMLFLATAATVACGLAPALEASRPNLTSALRDEGAAFGGGIRKSSLRGLMVGAQVAVCLVLLIGAVMLARTSQRALAVDLGFDYRNLVSLYVSFSPGTPRARIDAGRRQLAQELAGLPEVQAVAVAQRMPLTGGLRTILVSLHGGALDGKGNPNALYNLVTPGYFETLGIPIVRGRNFAPQELRSGFDFDGSPVIVSERTARRYWPGEDPVGKRFAFGRGRIRHFSGEEYPHSGSSVVIGVAKDVRSADLYTVDATCLYLPVEVSFSGTIAMRVRADEGKATTAIERAFRSSHGDLEAWVADSRAAFTNQTGFVMSRVGAIAAAVIGIFGLLMASVGIHGTAGFSVTQRIHEIGIRMALGSSRGAVLRLVLWETMRPVAIGLAVGFTLSAILARLLASYLFGLSALDPAAFAGGSAFLAIMALTAGYLPARRATRVDPAIALRYE